MPNRTIKPTYLVRTSGLALAALSATLGAALLVGMLRAEPGGQEGKQPPLPQTWAGMPLHPLLQPPTADVLAVRQSPDGDHIAYLFADGSGIDRLDVYGKAMGTDPGVPQPDVVDLSQPRSIMGLVWGSDGRTLYIVESATTNPNKSADRISGLSGDALIEMQKQDYSVLYAWRVGEDEAEVIDMIPGPVLSLDAAPGRIEVLSQSAEKGWGHLELRAYDTSGATAVAAGPPREIRMAEGGETVEYDRVQLLAERGEIWFRTMVVEDKANPRSNYEFWLAVMDLDKEKPEIERVERGIGSFSWSPDGRRVIMVAGPDRSGNDMRARYYLAEHGLLDQKRLIASPDVSLGEWAPSPLGVSSDGEVMYVSIVGAALEGPWGEPPPGAGRQVFAVELP